MLYYCKMTFICKVCYGWCNFSSCITEKKHNNSPEMVNWNTKTISVTALFISHINRSLLGDWFRSFGVMVVASSVRGVRGRSHSDARITTCTKPHFCNTLSPSWCTILSLAPTALWYKPTGVSKLARLCNESYLPHSLRGSVIPPRLNSGGTAAAGVRWAWRGSCHPETSDYFVGTKLC